MFTFAISCLTTSNLPWFMDLTFQVPMQYCSLQYQTLPFPQDTFRIGQHWNQIENICSQRWRSSIQSAKPRLGADCGSDHELLIAKFRLKLKKVGKTSRPFRYDLNQIPYDYTVEVTNRFKGLDLIDRVPEELWTEVHNIVQEAVMKTIPKKKKYKQSEEALQIAEKKKRSERQRRKGNIYPFECRVPKNSKER